MLVTGTLSAAATYYSPGGRSLPSITLKLVTGEDSTGARNQLISKWNQENPRTIVLVEEVRGETRDQKSAMVSHVQSGTADILNLDIIHIADFQSKGLISPIEIEEVGAFLNKPLTPGRMGGSASDQHWAVPFNTDVGMLFERRSLALPDEPGLADVIDKVADESGGFAGQLTSSSSAAAEAFTVNILEHALSRDPTFFEPGNWNPAPVLERWQSALEPLREAVEKKRLTRCNGESDTRNKFNVLGLPYMRNWPVKYRELQSVGDPDVQQMQIIVRSLPQGILGGQSLAVAENCTEKDRAGDVIRFLTSGPAQAILATNGLAPVRSEGYTDPAAMALIPHLDGIRGAVEQAVPRPLHPNYDAASEVIYRHSRKLLEPGGHLTTQFITELQAALA